MHSHSMSNWFCGPDGLLGFHFGGIFHLIFWAVCLILLFALFRAMLANKQHSPPSTGSNTSAISILEERYASGEIDQDEFLIKKKDLKYKL